MREYILKDVTTKEINDNDAKVIYTAEQAIKDYNRFNSEVCENTGTNCSETCPITLKNEYGCYLENINLEALQKWAKEAKKSDEEDKINAYTTIKQLKKDNAVLIDALKEAELCLEDNALNINLLEKYNSALIDVLKTAKLCLKYQKNTTTIAIDMIEEELNKQ